MEEEFHHGPPVERIQDALRRMRENRVRYETDAVYRYKLNLRRSRMLYLLQDDRELWQHDWQSPIGEYHIDRNEVKLLREIFPGEPGYRKPTKEQ